MLVFQLMWSALMQTKNLLKIALTLGLMSVGAVQAASSISTDDSATDMGSSTDVSTEPNAIAPETTVDPANRGSIDPALRNADPMNKNNMNNTSGSTLNKGTDPLNNPESTMQDKVNPTSPNTTSDPMLTPPAQHMKEPVHRSDEWPHRHPGNGVPVEPINR